MAVFPAARRVLSRPSWLPWSIAAVLLVAAITAAPAYMLLDTSPRAQSPALVAETGSAARTGAANELDAPTLTAYPHLTAHQQELFASLTASDVQMAAEEAMFLAPRPLVAEVSSIVARGEASIESEAPAPTSEAPANEAQTAAEALPPPLNQQVPQTQLSTVQRWATSGVIIETDGQMLDAASLANVDAALSSLPPGVLSNLGNPAFGPLHILVNLDGRVLSGDQPYGGPANFFSTNEGRNELVLYPQQSVFTIVHELGHAYNLRRIDAGRYAMVLLDPEMRSFLSATGWTITSSEAEIRSAVDHMHVSYSYGGSFHWPRLSNDDPLEDFANSFATFFLDPASLEGSSPERYAWMLATFGQ